MYNIDNLDMPARLWLLTIGGRIHANERVLVPLSSDMRAVVLKCEFSLLIKVCAVNPVAAILFFACLGEMNWSAPDCKGWFVYDFVDAAIITDTEWQTKSSR